MRNLSKEEQEQAAEFQRQYLGLDRSSGLVTQEMIDHLKDFGNFLEELKVKHG